MHTLMRRTILIKAAKSLLHDVPAAMLDVACPILGDQAEHRDKVQHTLNSSG